MADQLHVNVNILNSGVFGGAWRLPGTDPLASDTIEHCTLIAKKAEAAALDPVFPADGPVIEPIIAAAARNFGRDAEPDPALRYRRAGEFTERVVAQWAARKEFVSPPGRPVVVQAGGSGDGKRPAGQLGFSVDGLALIAEVVPLVAPTANATLRGAFALPDRLPSAAKEPV
jgi:hypothetical protein